MEQPEDNDCYAWVTDPFSNESSELNKKLQDFEQSSLHCEICRQFYCNAVSLRDCHHSFCSECIRVSLSIEKRGMKRIGSCPICRKEVKEDSDYIMPNWALQDAVDKYHNLRSMLYNSLVQLQQLKNESLAVNNVGKTVSTNEIDDSRPTLQKHDASESLGIREISLDRRCRKRKLVEIDNCDGHELNAESSDDNSSDAEYVDEEEELKEGSEGRLKIARHLKGLEGSTTKESSSQNIKNPCNTQLPIKPRTIPVYHGMKKSKLQELCSIEGLSNRGSDHELKHRHLEFLRLWNAECDAKNPRSKDQLVREIGKREDAKKVSFSTGTLDVDLLTQVSLSPVVCLMYYFAYLYFPNKAEIRKGILSGIQSHTKYIERIKESRRAFGTEETSTKKVTSGNASFDKTMDEQFKNLIKSYRMRTMASGKVVSHTEVSYGLEETMLPSKQSAEKLPQPSISIDNSESVNPSPTTVVIRDLPRNGAMTRFRSSSKRDSNDVATIPSNTCSLLKSDSVAKQSASVSKKNPVPTPSRKKWTCDRCTFDNEDIPWSNTKAKCVMCQMPRQYGLNTKTLPNNAEIIEIDDKLN